MKRFFTKPWLRALSGLSINISAAWLALPFIGTNISFPNSIFEFLILFADIGAGIIFLLITVLLEKELEKR